MAIIVSGVCRENYGKIVRVGNFIGTKIHESGQLFNDHDLWEVNKKIKFGWAGYYHLCSGKTMQRIDDNETKCLSDPARIEETA
jgi:hypothetical protein